MIPDTSGSSSVPRMVLLWVICARSSGRSCRDWRPKRGRRSSGLRSTTTTPTTRTRTFWCAAGVLTVRTCSYPPSLSQPAYASMRRRSSRELLGRGRTSTLSGSGGGTSTSLARQRSTRNSCDRVIGWAAFRSAGRISSRVWSVWKDGLWPGVGRTAGGSNPISLPS